MNYRNGNLTDVTVAKGAIVKKNIREGRYNAIFMTYDELRKTWSQEQKHINSDK